jgi:putative transposase
LEVEFPPKELCMKKSKFSEEQIVRILKEVEAGAKVGETCRKHGISEPTYYAWKNKYAGMDVSQLRHLKDVEVELARLKRMYAELALEHHALKDVLSRKG